MPGSWQVNPVYRDDVIALPPRARFAGSLQEIEAPLAPIGWTAARPGIESSGSKVADSMSKAPLASLTRVLDRVPPA
jgi:hypothetical protein